MNEWANLLEAYNTSSTANSSEGMSLNEIMEQTGWARTKATSIVRHAIKSGMMKATKKAIENMAGTRSTVPSYVVVQPSKSKKK